MSTSDQGSGSGASLRYFSGDSDLIDLTDLSDADVDECVRVMEALRG